MRKGYARTVSINTNLTCLWVDLKVFYIVKEQKEIFIADEVDRHISSIKEHNLLKSCKMMDCWRIVPRRLLLPGAVLSHYSNYLLGKRESKLRFFTTQIVSYPHYKTFGQAILLVDSIVYLDS